MAVGTAGRQRMVQAYQTLDVLLPGADLELLGKRRHAGCWSAFGASPPGDDEHENGRGLPVLRGVRRPDLRDALPGAREPDPAGALRGDPLRHVLGAGPAVQCVRPLTPYIGKLVEAENGGGKAKVILDEILNMGKLLLALPQKTDALLSRIEAGKVE